MQQPKADSQPTIKRGAGADPQHRDGVAGDLDPANDRLLELLEIWQDRYLQGVELSAESLTVDDPSLLQAVSSLIEQQKRLRAYLRITPGSPLVAPPGQIARERQDSDHKLPAGERPALGTVAPSPETVLTAIGRYHVTRVLGQGGFGRVYLAHDPDLDRDVAIKVPIPGGTAQFVDVEAYLREARILAQLAHPNIVPVYDVGRTANGHFYVVSKYIDGGDLATRMHRDRPTISESAALVAALCEALHYTHTRDLFHRDIKPANILLDAAGQPSLADFGLALKDENVGQGAQYVGTAAYMSPEQARGEGHLVDGRSDIFSMGIVLYELLTGRHPFRGGPRQDVMQRIISAEPRPPRQIDDTIPQELERICLKALAKRASERYTTARDPAEDLRHFLRPALVLPAKDDATQIATSVAVPTEGALEGLAASVSAPADSSVRSITIIPKGLASFDENDADFFLDLLPGPRDRDGLPDVLRFWKSRIDATDQDRTFRVGLIYGPSGCGKSSLVKAGLLPRVGPHILFVYVEATAAHTEDRLVRGLAKRFPDLPAGAGLIGSLTMLRRGHALPTGHKALLVLDQFEQWLFSHGGEAGTELIAALRQCDGEHLQALCLIRDDFWMAATRFMKDLEIDLVPDRNTAAVDLFDHKHTRKVLAGYGRAYEALPPRSAQFTKEHRAFIDEAVAGLAHDGRVVPVRLALFAEMVRDKPWAPATLRAVSGMEGVGVRFLDDTFSSPRSNPKYRYHQKAAQAVLKSLLPETNADIKGRMRSVEELRRIAGYGDRPGDFIDLTRMLDTELRLITPVDLESSIDPDTPPPVANDRCYQLTHDYLVHALREWLTRKQRETRRGRAELVLAERAALWNAKPENRYLPSFRECAKITLLTNRDGWTESERRIMRAATRYHGARAAVMVTLLSAAAAAGIWLDGRLREQHRETFATGLVKQLLVADIDKVPRIIETLGGHRERTRPTLAAIAADSSRPPGERLRASLALLPDDRSQIDYLLGRALGAEPDELLVIRDPICAYRDLVTKRLWVLLEGRSEARMRRFRAACLLAALDPRSEQWARVSPDVAEALVSEGPLHVNRWMDALRPVSHPLLEPLSAIVRNEGRSEVERSLAIAVLTDFAAKRPDVLADLIQFADAPAFDAIMARLQEHGERAVGPLTLALNRELSPAQHDPSPQNRWVQADRTMVDEIERAQGFIHDQFALCQAMELDRFQNLAEGLRRSGYRPVRLRPFRAGGIIRVAAVWTRDGRDWQVLLGARAEDVAAGDAARRSQGYEPVDIAAFWPICGQDAEARYLACWAKADAPEFAREARIFLGEEDASKLTLVATEHEGLRCVALHRSTGPDGRIRYSGVARRSVNQAVFAIDEDFSGYEAKVGSNGPQEDVCLDIASAPEGPEVRERVESPPWAGRIRYAAIWGNDPGWESRELHGLPPSPHLIRCRSLAEQGFRPASIAVVSGAGGDGLLAASTWRQPRISNESHDALARRKSRAAVALARLGRSDQIWSQLRMSDDPSLRTYLIHDLGPLGVDLRVVLRRLAAEDDPSARRALILALGQYPSSAISDESRQALVTTLLGFYAHDPDSGVHAAAGWLLHRWGRGDAARQIDVEVAALRPGPGRSWYVDSEGLTFAILRTSGDVELGSPQHEANFKPDEAERLVRIERTFALCVTVVTVGQYSRFLREHPEFRREEAISDQLSLNVPIEAIDAFEAAAFCRWLGERDGIADDQQCFPPLPRILEARRDGNLPLTPGYLKRTGYRFPTDAEWEFACRSGSRVIRPFGRSISMLPYYGWSGLSSGWHAHPVGELKPNEFGLFDMIGSVYQWCLELESPAPLKYGGRPNRDDAELAALSRGITIRLRGGGYNYSAPMLRSAFRNGIGPETRFKSIGLRVAKTMNSF